MSDKILRRLTRSELKYGMILVNMTSVKKFYSKLPPLFTVILDGEKIKKRHIIGRRLTLGKLLKKYDTGTLLELTIIEDELIISSQTSEE